MIVVSNFLEHSLGERYKINDRVFIFLDENMADLLMLCVLEKYCSFT